VLDAITKELAEIDRRIVDLLALREALTQLQKEGAILPLNDVEGENCVCYLLKTYRDTGEVVIHKGNLSTI
jgi:hypothetical protein